MREERPSLRTERTGPATSVTSSGILKVKRASVPTGGKTLTIPEKINGAVIKNSGENTVRFNFGNDGASDFWTLLPGEKSPPLPLLDKVKINVRSIGSPSVIECIFWG